MAGEDEGSSVQEKDTANPDQPTCGTCCCYVPDEEATKARAQQSIYPARIGNGTFNPPHVQVVGMGGNGKPMTTTVSPSVLIGSVCWQHPTLAAAREVLVREMVRDEEHQRLLGKQVGAPPARPAPPAEFGVPKK